MVSTSVKEAGHWKFEHPSEFFYICTDYLLHTLATPQEAVRISQVVDNMKGRESDRDRVLVRESSLASSWYRKNITPDVLS